MTCAHCSVGRVSEETGRCLLCGAAAAEHAAESPRLPPELEPRFRIERVLLQDGRSARYVAHDLEADRLVALRVMPVPANEVGDRVERFRREAQRAVTLDHPHIARLDRYGVTPTHVWYATEFVEGRSLAARLSDAGPLPLAATLRIVYQVASALDYAHRRRMAHGRLTPSQVVLENDAWVRVTDFGVARALAPNDDEAAAAGPRAAAGVGAAGDQGALAWLVYACLTGKPAANGASGDPEGVPAHVRDALRRARSRRPADLFPSVVEFATALSAGGPVSARPSPGPRQPVEPHSTADPRPPAGARPPAAGPAEPRRPPPVVLIDPEPEPRRGRRLAFAVGALVVIATGAFAWARLSRDSVLAASLEALSSRPPDDVPPPDTESAAPAALPLRSVESPQRRESASGGAVVPGSVPARSQPPLRQTSPPPAPAPVRAAPDAAYLLVNSTPWAVLFVDGRLVGNTPQAGLAVVPGVHRVRLTQDGFHAVERVVVVAAGDTVRMTDFVLQPIRP